MTRCEWCGARLPASSGTGRPLKFCSDSHRQLSYVARRRRVDLLAVAERDGWRCYLCGERLPEWAIVPDRWAATLDHVIPVSAGGADHESNVRLAGSAADRLPRRTFRHSDETQWGAAVQVVRPRLRRAARRGTSPGVLPAIVSPARLREQTARR